MSEHPRRRWPQIFSTISLSLARLVYLLMLSAVRERRQYHWRAAYVESRGQRAAAHGEGEWLVLPPLAPPLRFISFITLSLAPVYIYSP